MEWLPIVTISVAVYGAVVATVVAIWNIVTQIRQNKPRVRVRLSMGFMGSFGPSGEPMKAMVLIQPTNIGFRTVTLNMPCIVLPDKTPFYLPPSQANVKWPHELSSGKQCTAFIEARDFAQQIKKAGYAGRIRLIAAIDDQTGVPYHSKALDFDLDTWAGAS